MYGSFTEIAVSNWMVTGCLTKGYSNWRRSLTLYLSTGGNWIITTRTIIGYWFLLVGKCYKCYIFCVIVKYYGNYNYIDAVWCTRDQFLFVATSHKHFTSCLCIEWLMEIINHQTHLKVCVTYANKSVLSFFSAERKDSLMHNQPAYIIRALSWVANFVMSDFDVWMSDFEYMIKCISKNKYVTFAQFSKKVT